MTPRRQDTPQLITIGKVAELTGYTIGQVRKLYERGILPEPQRCGFYRVVLTTEVPKIEAALKARYRKRERAAAGK